MQVRQDYFLVIGCGEQIVGVHRETNGPNLIRVRSVDLDNPVTAYVPQHTGSILVAGRKQTTRWIDTDRSKSTS